MCVYYCMCVYVHDLSLLLFLQGQWIHTKKEEERDEGMKYFVQRQAHVGKDLHMITCFAQYNRKKRGQTDTKQTIKRECIEISFS